MKNVDYHGQKEDGSLIFGNLDGITLIIDYATQMKELRDQQSRHDSACQARYQDLTAKFAFYKNN